jgi:hypothetical protein
MGFQLELFRKIRIKVFLSLPFPVYLTDGWLGFAAWSYTAGPLQGSGTVQTARRVESFVFERLVGTENALLRADHYPDQLLGRQPPIDSDQSGRWIRCLRTVGRARRFAGQYSAPGLYVSEKTWQSRVDVDWMVPSILDR